MTYCLNPNCLTKNEPDASVCKYCGDKLLLGGRYQAKEYLSENEFCRTFKAVDWRRLGTSCVLKQFIPLSRESLAQQKNNSMFLQEAVRLLDIGKHRQIPYLLGFFEEDERLYVVEEFVDGENLRSKLNKGKFSEERVRQVMTNLLPVLEFIHSRQMIHLDIKPDNIIQQADGNLVLINFGVYTQLSGTNLIDLSTFTGTPGYAAPEQIIGFASPASDLYAFGITCIRLLTGCLPSHDGTDKLFDPKRMELTWRPRVKVSDELGQILDKLLGDKNSGRYQSAAEVMVALNQSSSDPQFSGVRVDAIIKALNAANKDDLLGSVAYLLLKSRKDPNIEYALKAVNHWKWSKCLLTIRNGYVPINSIAFSPDGKTLASGTLDEDIKIYSVLTGQEIRTLYGHTQSVFSVAFSPDGTILASGSADNTMRGWDVLTGLEIAGFGCDDLEYGNWVREVAFHPTMAIIASANDDKTIKICEEDGEICTLDGHFQEVTCVVFSPNGETLVSSSFDNTIKIWDCIKFEQIRTISVQPDVILSLAYSPDGKRIASVSKNGDIKIWDVLTGQEIRTLIEYYGSSVAFSRDGLLASGCSSGSIEIWDVTTGEIIANLDGHSESVHALAFSPDGQTLASGSEYFDNDGGSYGTIKLWGIRYP